MKKLGCILLAVVCALSCFAGCQTTPPVEEEPITYNSVCANITSGGGQFAFRDDFIYFSDVFNIYEYDLTTGKTVVLHTSWNRPLSMYVTEDRVYYASDGLHYVTRDGKETDTVFFCNESYMYLYADGNTVYYRTTVRHPETKMPLDYLVKRDLETGEETPLVGSLWYDSYSVDSKYIYALINEKTLPDADPDQNRVVRSEKGNIHFEEIPMDIHPTCIYPSANGLYMNKGAKLYRWKDGVLTDMNMPTGEFHIWGDYQITNLRNGVSGSSLELCMYHLETGEKTVISDSSYLYAVLNDRYVCYWKVVSDVHHQWYYYDLQTGETKLMYEIEDSKSMYNYTVS